MKRKRITWGVHIASLLLIAVMAVSFFTTILPSTRELYSLDVFNSNVSSFEESEDYKTLCFDTAAKVLRYSWLKNRVEQNDVILVTKENGEFTSYTMDTFPVRYYSHSMNSTDEIVWCAFFSRFPDVYDPDSVLSGSSMNLGDYSWEICNEIEFYQNFEQTSQAEFSNVHYSVRQGETTLLDNGCETPNYTLTLPASGEFTTSLDEARERPDYNRFYIDSNYFVTSKETITVSLQVETSYPYLDSFAKAHNSFETFRSCIPQLGWLIAGLIICLITFILLIVFTNGLYAFDKLWLEPFLAGAGILFCGIGLLLIGMIDWFDLMYTRGETEWILPLLGTALAAAVIVLWFSFLIPFLSLVRRLKAHSFWKYSITGKICGAVKNFWQLAFTSKKDSRKVFYCSMLFVLLLVLHFFAMFSWDYRESFAQFGPLLLFALLFFYLARKLLLQAKSRDKLVAATDELVTGNVPTLLSADDFAGDDRLIADNLNHIGTGLKTAVETATKSERMKTELITNVSHDIKTPLTSIINYVDLLKREELDNETANGYLQVLEEKAQKLKQLTEDLVEASKASSGNITLEMNRLNFTELLQQVNGEFAEKLEEADLQLVETLPEEALCIIGDGRYLWRVLENLYTNALKYAMPRTRVYAALTEEDGRVHFTLKNISAAPLNIEAEELTERFTRGDASRNSEGSGLGLSIAKSLTELQGGSFVLTLDGDLFRVDVTFPKV